MKEYITLGSQIPIRDDLVAGTILCKNFPECEVDFTKQECYYIGNPISFVWAFHDYREQKLGRHQAEITLCRTRDDFRVTKTLIKNMLESFFKNEYYDNYRLIALVNPQNKQAIRFVKLCGGILEGRLRKVDGDDDRLLFSILKEDYYGWHSQ